jgi:hypothetical protein
MATVMERPAPPTYAQYHRIRGINWSTLSEMRRSPLHYKTRLEVPRTSTPAMDLGRLIHWLVLEPATFLRHYVVWEGARRGNEYKAFAEAAELHGMEVVTAADYERAQAVAGAVFRHRAARSILSRGRPEVSLKWVDPETRMRCKARLDWVRGGALTELKSTTNVDARKFGRLAVDIGYISQLAFYRRGLTATGHRDGPTRIIAVEVDEPNDVAVYEIDNDMLWAGDELVGELLARVKECRKRGSWPGRYPKPQPLDVPPWFYGTAEGEEREIARITRFARSEA